MGGPEISRVGARDAQDLIQREALPRRTALRVPGERRRVGDAEQFMQQAGVAHVDLRCLDLAFAEVRMPGLQLAQKEGLRQPVEVTPHGAFVDAHRASGLSGVPRLAVVVGHHRPEPMHRRRGCADAELRQVALDDGSDELAPPDAACRIVGRRVRTREPAAPPEHGSVVDTGFVEREAAGLDHFDPARERLAALSQQRRRRAAQQQEARRIAGPVDQHAQHLEQIGRVLHLVDHDQAAQAAQRRHRLGELRLDLRVFEIEVVRRICSQQRPRQRRLADLARPDQGDRRAALQRGTHLGLQCFADQHHASYLEIPASKAGISRASL